MNPLAAARPYRCALTAVGLASIGPLAVLSLPATTTPPTAAAAATPGCTTLWTGAGTNNSWDNPANWYYHKVPTERDDVCVSAFVFIFATGHITIHSLQIGNQSSIDLGETTGAPQPSILDATSFIANAGNLDLYDSTVDTPKLTNTNGMEGAAGNSTINSARFSSTGNLSTADADLTVTDRPAQRRGLHLVGDPFDTARTLTGQPRGVSSSSSAGPAPNSITIEPGAEITAGGSIFGNLDNGGTVACAATLSLDGNYAQTVKADLIAGNGQVLGVSGTATIAGTLEALPSVPPPTPGTRSTAITFASRTGAFTRHSLGFRLVNTSTSVVEVAEPQIGVAPHTVAPGGTATVQGGDFPYEATVDVYLDGAGGTPLATATTDHAGLFSTSVTLPSSTPSGGHDLIAVSGTTRASKNITVS